MSSHSITVTSRRTVITGSCHIHFAQQDQLEGLDELFAKLTPGMTPLWLDAMKAMHHGSHYEERS